MKYYLSLIFFLGTTLAHAQYEGYTLENRWRDAKELNQFSRPGFKFKDGEQGLQVTQSTSGKFCNLLPVRLMNRMTDHFIDVRDFSYTFQVSFNDVPKEEAAIGLFVSMASEQLFDSVNDFSAFGCMVSTAGNLYVLNKSVGKQSLTMEFANGLAEFSNFEKVNIGTGLSTSEKTFVTVTRTDKKWSVQVNYKEVYTAEVNSLNPFCLRDFPALLFHNKSNLTLSYEKAFFSYRNSSMNNYMRSFPVQSGTGLFHSDCLTQELPVKYELTLVEGLPAMTVTGNFCDASNNIPLVLPFTNKKEGKYEWLNNDIRAKYTWCLGNKPFEFDYVDMKPDKTQFSFRIKGDAKYSSIGDNNIVRTTECYNYLKEVK